MFEPFQNATTNAKVVHVLLTLFIFISWVSTMVTFGSSLATVKNGGLTLDFYWNKFKASGEGPTNSGSLGDYDSVFHQSCDGGSKGTLAFAVFAFLAFIVHIPLLVARMGGFSLPMIRDAAHSMKIEFLCTCLELFCFFIQTTVYGGACFTGFRSKFESTQGTGYGLVIACFFFLIISLIFYVMMRSNTSYAIGDGSGKASDHSGYGDNYSGGGNEYNNDISSQPTFSYQGGDETST